MKKITHIVAIALILCFAGLALGSMGTAPAHGGGGGGGGGTGVFTLVNDSSHTVEVFNSLGAFVVSLRPGTRQNVSTGLIGNINTFRYNPGDRVGATISGSTVRFWNR